MRTITYPITPAHAGMSVERYLKQEHGYSTRTLVKLKHYPQGLQLNGQHARTVDLLQAGDTLAVTFLDSQEHGVEHFIRSNRRVEIPYEDDDLLVFNKPADMPCHQSCGHAADTLANVFAAHCDHLGLDLMYRPLNRLDRDTSGCLFVDILVFLPLIIVVLRVDDLACLLRTLSIVKSRSLFLQFNQLLSLRGYTLVNAPQTPKVTQLL